MKLSPHLLNVNKSRRLVEGSLLKMEREDHKLYNLGCPGGNPSDRRASYAYLRPSDFWRCGHYYRNSHKSRSDRGGWHPVCALVGLFTYSYLYPSEQNKKKTGNRRNPAGLPGPEGQGGKDRYFARTVGNRMTRQIIDKYIKHHPDIEQGPAQLF